MDGGEKQLLVLWTTGKCNLSCSYCYASAGREEGSFGPMEEEIALAAVECFKGRPLSIQFSGGEPLLEFALMKKVAEYVINRGIRAEFRLQTNGTLLAEEHVQFIKEYKVAVGVSLDGPPKVNECTRGRTAEVVRGIRLLARHGICVNLNAVVTEENVKSLPELVDFAWYLESVKGIGLDLLRAAGRGEENFPRMKAGTTQITKALFAMEERRRKLSCLTGRNVAIREVEEAKRRLSLGKRTPYCYASCGRAAAVLPDGNVYPCGSLAGRKGYEMGNVRNGQITEKKLPSAEMELDGKERDKRCSVCLYYQVCPGSCPSRRILNGNPEADCTLRKTAFQIAEENYV